MPTDQQVGELDRRLRRLEALRRGGAALRSRSAALRTYPQADDPGAVPVGSVWVVDVAPPEVPAVRIRVADGWVDVPVTRTP